MWKQIVKVVSAWFILKWLKPRWKSTTALLLAWFFTTKFHSDYLNYVELAEDSSFLVLSYIMKWTFMVGATAMYVTYLILQSSKMRSVTEINEKEQIDKKLPPAGDGFDFLRNKAKLQSRGDKILGRTEKK